MKEKVHGGETQSGKQVAMVPATDPCTAYGNTVTAEIQEVFEESAEVLRLRLHISESFSFSPGQWVRGRVHAGCSVTD